MLMKKQEPDKETTSTAESPGAENERQNQRAQHHYTTYEPGDLLEINDYERGITPEDSDDVKWNYISGACKHRLVLSGTVSGVENQFSDNPICVIDYEGIRILIPGREMFMDRWEEGVAPPVEMRARLGRCLGATIDFVLEGVDIRNRAAVASRRAAMLQRQAKYYATGRVHPGIRVACRVIGIANNRIAVEAIGVDSIIRAGQLSWEWFSDVYELYSIGDLVVARVMAVDKDEETGAYSVQLSIKAATENPDLPVLRRLIPGSTYFGVVTGVFDRLIFVRLQTGANAKTKLYHTKQIPSKLDTVSFQVRRVDEESGVALGLITRIIRHHTRSR